MGRSRTIASTPSGWRGYVAQLLINRNYALFLSGAFVSALGVWMQTVALGWLVLELSNSAFLLGLTSFMQMVPLFAFSLVGGAVADRVDRRRLLIITQGMSTISAALLALLTAIGLINIPIILILALIGGILNSFQWPTWQVFIKDLVGPEQLRSAIAVNAARVNLTRVLGPALGGFLLGSIGVAGCLAIGAVAMLGVQVSFWAIRLQQPAAKARSLSWLPVLWEGIAYGWRDRQVREVLLATSALGILAMPYQAFLPAFARDVLHVGEQGLGILLSSVGLGAVAGALGSGTRRVGRRPYLAMGALMCGTGLSLAVFALTDRPWLALPALALVGLGSIGYMSTANATIQLAVPDGLMGRIMGLWVMVNAGTMPIGSLAIGVVADRIGVQLAVAAGGILCALLGASMAWRHNVTWERR